MKLILALLASPGIASAKCFEPNNAHPPPEYNAHDPLLADAFAYIDTALKAAAGRPEYAQERSTGPGAVWDGFCVEDVDRPLYAGLPVNEVVFWDRGDAGVFGEVELPGFRLVTMTIQDPSRPFTYTAVRSIIATMSQTRPELGFKSTWVQSISHYDSSTERQSIYRWQLAWP
ncbi:predicted protein [Plenodomus lingam JN3]|uniref:Uncharacterized protein n=1 Tax=Leptosphaeria maculans (strain JN3 / isolate v23.1.3 / race Av1-4-5-6-7-8) TaxID=985895 RepID=E4ZH05_LEPMJ|nr:predicted protein [Plenodomus lingam JN3]CBX90575.1 predicted protein [Plenodomus lingam JN3]